MRSVSTRGSAGTMFDWLNRSSFRYGPKPTPPSAAFHSSARLLVEVKLAPFSSGTTRFTPGKETEATTISAQLQQALLPSLMLDALPKSQIDILFTVLESDGHDNDLAAWVQLGQEPCAAVRSSTDSPLCESAA